MASCIPSADLCIYQGDDYAVIVQVSNADGSPADLTGYTVRAQLRRGVADSSETVVLTFGATVAGQNITLAIPHTETTALKGVYKWDLELTSPAGMVQTILQGSANIAQEITR